MSRFPGVAWLAACLAACGAGDSTEERIRTLIGELETHAEAGDRRAFMAHLAPDFLGQNGMTHEEFRAYFILQLNRYRRLRATLMPISVEHAGGERARAEFRALVTGGPGLLPEQGQLYDVTTLWVRRDGDWLLHQATWEAVLE